MQLSQAIDVLIAERRLYELRIQNGNGTVHDEMFVESVNVVLKFVDEFVCLLMRK